MILVTIQFFSINIVFIFAGVKLIELRSIETTVVLGVTIFELRSSEYANYYLLFIVNDHVKSESKPYPSTNFKLFSIVTIYFFPGIVQLGIEMPCFSCQFAEEMCQLFSRKAGNDAISDVEMVDFSELHPEYKPIQSLKHPRYYVYPVLLPDKTVLVIKVLPCAGIIIKGIKDFLMHCCTIGRIVVLKQEFQHRLSIFVHNSKVLKRIYATHTRLSCRNWKLNP